MSNTFTQADNVTAETTQTTLWQVEIFPLPGLPDRLAAEVLDGAAFLSLPESLNINAARGFLIQGALDQTEIETLSRNLLVDPVVEKAVVSRCGHIETDQSLSNLNSIYVLPQPGVTDPQAESAMVAMRATGANIDAVRTFRRYFVSESTDDQLARLSDKLLCNDSIELIVHGDLQIDQIELGRQGTFELQHVELTEADDDQLMALSKQWQLSLTLVEMQTIQAHFKSLGRQPTDIELETVAQTWSEHCSHKTLAGRVEYTDNSGTRNFENMLKETIFAATVSIRETLGDDDWCVSVFKDNAGIVRFDDQYNVAFKVETHNRPSALEPYGGANTGIGGVIRDTLGTGLGAKPVCNTDVFCFASPETDFADLPPGVMHPAMIMKGVVSGVRDYGNRMGIPTVNGAVYFDQRYIGNPLVFCGNVGLIPTDKSEKEPQPNDLIVTIGGRTGRDGIHGATFSSAELTEESDVTSGGAVQIGNAITEKMVMDVLLAARDRDLYSAVTDCGAGGFSSAVGEMGEEIGAEVWLDKAPLKYDGLSYTEIWISEAQERMVFAVPEDKWEEFRKLCESESVEATVIGRYTPTGNLTLKYGDNTVGELSMEFLHDGRPPVIRKAEFNAPETAAVSGYTPRPNANGWTSDLRSILGSLNVASKHWIIRQYDHEVQGGSVIKPLVGVNNDGPGDAAVVRPVLDSRRGLAISCGMNPHYGDIDPYHMATSSIDEAIRNCVAVGADPSRIAILDNFCWGYTDRPATLGTLVRAALGCHDLSIVMQTPFISGKDSLNNEFSYTDPDGQRQTISIPSTLLISAMGQVPDVANCVTMDLKKAGNLLYQVGVTGEHLGGSHWSLVSGASGGQVPTVDSELAKTTYEKLHSAISSGLVRSCHDMSEGGLAAAVAEMAFAGDLGASINVDNVEIPETAADGVLAKLFSESNTRFVVEIEAQRREAFEAAMDGISITHLGEVVEIDRLEIRSGGELCIESELSSLKAAWQNPLDWS
ncbi:MAG: phosphoribosylformylglycinamidine synthase subunit PurL [Planctomycetota bacterium]